MTLIVTDLNRYSTIKIAILKRSFVKEPEKGPLEWSTSNLWWRPRIIRQIYQVLAGKSIFQLPKTLTSHNFVIFYSIEKQISDSKSQKKNVSISPPCQGGCSKNVKVIGKLSLFFFSKRAISVFIFRKLLKNQEFIMSISFPSSRNEQVLREKHFLLLIFGDQASRMSFVRGDVDIFARFNKTNIFRNINLFCILRAGKGWM